MDVDEEDGDEVDSGATHGQAYKRLAPKSAKTIRENALQVAPGSTLSLRLAVELGTGLHPTEGAPMAWQISAKGKLCRKWTRNGAFPQQEASVPPNLCSRFSNEKGKNMRESKDKKSWYGLIKEVSRFLFPTKNEGLVI